MTQGSTVTYKSVSLRALIGWVDKMPARATNSACLVPFKVRFVSFMPRPMISPSLTKTQPTGVSSLFSASSACLTCQPRCRAGRQRPAKRLIHHVYGLAHEALMIHFFLRVHGAGVVICRCGLAGLLILAADGRWQRRRGDGWPRGKKGFYGKTLLPLS